MKFIPLHTKNTVIIYKNSLCSGASFIVITLCFLSVVIPIFLVSFLSPHPSIDILYEKPNVEFEYKSIFMADTASYGKGWKTKNIFTDLYVCSTFAKLNEIFKEAGNKCDSLRYWTHDLDKDGASDRVHFLQQTDSLECNLTSLKWILVMQAKLKHKCNLSPPAILDVNIDIPMTKQFRSGLVTIDAELFLRQHIEFICPYLGRNVRSQFNTILINPQSRSDLKQYRTSFLLQELKPQPGYFQLKLININYEPRSPEVGLSVQLNLDIEQVGVRYQLSIWERLTQCWLYFASFFGFSFYLMNKLKDYLFSKHIVRSWEIIPWKKLY
uniref:Transmembrane protein 231 n=1 Tax=Glossina brevipalpis TaxID=37001 RepID=A0A1A9WQ05_9MUSC